MLLLKQNEDKNKNRSDKSTENIDLEQKKIDQLTAQLEKDISLDSKMLAPIQDRINQLNEEFNAVQNKPGGLFSNKKKDLENKVNWSECDDSLYNIEKYNGLGYLKYRPINSPYLWSGTNHYTKGKYVADGKYSSTAIDKQLGTCAILKRMSDRGVSIGFD